PLAIREMQKASEIVTVYAYLQFAEIGLFSILAHFTPHEKFEQFRSVKREYAQQFLAAVQPIGNPSLYEDKENLFQWVEEESDRAMSRTLVGNILMALEVIEIMRRQGAQGHRSGDQA
ncbi:MAG: hypothetical protein ACREU4_04935, partial [Burkholderiales bacterium]